MYKNVHCLGKTLEEWQKAFSNNFSLGELYRMMLEGKNFNLMLATYSA